MNESASSLILALEQVLTKKDVKVEFFLNSLADSISEEIKVKGGSRVSGEKGGKQEQPPPPKKQKNVVMEGASEENKQQLMDLTDDKFSELSILLNHKFGHILKQHLVQKEESKAAKCLSQIKLPLQDVGKMFRMYRECFGAWVDSPFVSYVAHSKLPLGGLAEKDCFVLHLFAFLTCYRTKGDNLYALCVSGASTTGKTLIFEDPVLEIGHQHVAEAGVGRWLVGKRSVLCYHDVPLERLVKGPDGEKFKTVCRSERSTCKIFGSTSVLPPLFVFVTSNQNVQTHRNTLISKPPGGQFVRAAPPAQLKTERVNSKLDLIYSEKKREALKETICAVKSRILEAYVSQKPVLDQKNIPTSGNFSRLHAVLGIFERVLKILEKYDLASFQSPALWRYAVSGLVDNFANFQTVAAGEEGGKRVFPLLLNVLKKFAAQEKHNCSSAASLKYQIDKLVSLATQKDK